LKNFDYLCNRYPENNLFTLKELIPIEDKKRLSVKTVAFCVYIRKVIIFGGQSLLLNHQGFL